MYQKWLDGKYIAYTDKRNLIDTMIAANPVLNGQRNNIDSIVHFNNENEKVDILYDNFIIYIDNAMKNIKDIKSVNDNEFPEALQKDNKNRKDMFVLFLFLEFIKKLFKQININLDSYMKAKVKVIQVLLLTPSLHESSALITRKTAEFFIDMTEEDKNKTKKHLIKKKIYYFLML